MPGPVLGSILGAHAAALAGDLTTASAIANGEERVGLVVGNGEYGYIVDGEGCSIAVALTPTHCHLIDITRLRISKVLDCLDIATDLKRVEYGGDAVTMTIDGQLAAVFTLVARCSLPPSRWELRRSPQSDTLNMLSSVEQFGQPIGGFQAIKTAARTWRYRRRGLGQSPCKAAVQVAGDAPPCKLVATLAKAVADRAARFNAADKYREPRGIGYTWTRWCTSVRRDVCRGFRRPDPLHASGALGRP